VTAGPWARQRAFEFPILFGRGGEECDALRAAGIEVEVIGGLTAGIAAPAAIGLPVTDRRFTQGVALVTGHAGGEREPDWDALARSGLTLVIYMGVARVHKLVTALTHGGLGADTPAAVISAAHTPRQRHALCTLATLAGTIRSEKLANPAILVVGDVVQAAPLWAAISETRISPSEPAVHLAATPARRSDRSLR